MWQQLQFYCLQFIYDFFLKFRELKANLNNQENGTKIHLQKLANQDVEFLSFLSVYQDQIVDYTIRK